MENRNEFQNAQQQNQYGTQGGADQYNMPPQKVKNLFINNGGSGSSS